MSKNKNSLASSWLLPAVIIVAIVSALGIKSIRYISLFAGDYDTGIYSNIVYNILRGNYFFSTILGINHLGEHFSPIMALFVPFFAIWPSALWLYIAQGAAVSLFYVQVYRLALKEFRPVSPHAAVLALAVFTMALAYKPLTGALLFDFHPTTIVVPVLFVAIMAVRNRHWRLLAVCVPILLIAKENGVLAVFGLALIALFETHSKRAFIVLSSVALIAAAFIFLWFMPQFQQGEWHHYSRLGPLAKLGWKALYLFGGLLLPLAFLPIVGWRIALGAVPLIVLNLSVSYRPQFSTNYQYDDLISVFLVVSALYGLKTLLRRAELARWQHAASFLISAVFGTALISGFLGGFALMQAGESCPDPAKLDKFREIMHYSSLPARQTIATTGDLGAYFANRDGYVRITDDNISNIEYMLSDDDILVLDLAEPEINAKVLEYLESSSNSVVLERSEFFLSYRVFDENA